MKEVADKNRGTKRQSNYLSKPLFETGSSREEKRRCKTPYYICEKTRNSIILHRPIVIKSDDVSKLTSSKHNKNNSQHPTRSQCVQVSAACKRKLTSKDDENAKPKKMKSQTSETSTFIGVNSFFHNYSNLKHLSDVQKEEKESQQNDEDDKKYEEI